MRRGADSITFKGKAANDFFNLLCSSLDNAERQRQLDERLGIDKLTSDPLGPLALELARCCSPENGPELNALRIMERLRSKILHRSLEASRLRGRWLKVHACIFEPYITLTDERYRKIIRICNRLADRIDAANPWPSGSKHPRLDEPKGGAS